MFYSSQLWTCTLIDVDIKNSNSGEKAKPQAQRLPLPKERTGAKKDGDVDLHLEHRASWSIQRQGFNYLVMPLTLLSYCLLMHQTDEPIRWDPITCELTHTHAQSLMVAFNILIHTCFLSTVLLAGGGGGVMLEWGWTLLPTPSSNTWTVSLCGVMGAVWLCSCLHTGAGPAYLTPTSDITTPRSFKIKKWFIAVNYSTVKLLFE